METEHYRFGFTERGVQLSALQTFLGGAPLLQLNQVHGNRIVPLSAIEAETEGDGILLDQKGMGAIIRTADCTPLFVLPKNDSSGALLHVGWRGLHQGIEKLLTEHLDLDEYLYFIGPAIEGPCYEVGDEFRSYFGDRPYGNQILNKKENGKYTLDVGEGIKQSLMEMGVAENVIFKSDICTLCHPDFPSYRGGDRELRIYNFLMLK